MPPCFSTEEDIVPKLLAKGLFGLVAKEENKNLVEVLEIENRVDEHKVKNVHLDQEKVTRAEVLVEGVVNPPDWAQRCRALKFSQARPRR